MVVNYFETGNWLSIYLKEVGHRVMLVSTYAESRAVLARASYDVLISDVRLPDGDGWQLLRDIQSARPIYAIALSRSDWDGERTKSKAAGFRQHFLTPIWLKEFDSALREAALTLKKETQNLLDRPFS